MFFSDSTSTSKVVIVKNDCQQRIYRAKDYANLRHHFSTISHEEIRNHWHKHPNGGGWVENCSVVMPGVFVGPEACVSGKYSYLDCNRQDSLKLMGKTHCRFINKTTTTTTNTHPPMLNGVFKDFPGILDRLPDYTYGIWSEDSKRYLSVSPDCLFHVFLKTGIITTKTTETVVVNFGPEYSKRYSIPDDTCYIYSGATLDVSRMMFRNILDGQKSNGNSSPVVTVLKNYHEIS